MNGTILGFVLGALIGAIATMAGSYFVHRQRRRETTRRLRRAFRTELESMAYLDDLLERGEYERLTRAIETPIVYEANADKIGHLSDEEIAALVEFYAGTYWLRDLEDVEDKKGAVADVVERRTRALDLLARA